MTAQQQAGLPTTMPDLSDISLDALGQLGDTPLARSIALYRERLRKDGVPLSSFNARI